MTDTIDLTQSKQYTLSIRLSTDGFSFSVLNPTEKAIPVVIDYPINESLSLTANLKQAFKEVKELTCSYRRVNLLLANRRFTFIPLEFFEDEQCETVFYHNFPTRENETVLYNILHRNNIVVLFGMDKSACNYLREQQPDIRFYAQASAFTEYFSAKSRLGNNRKIYVNLHKKAIDVYVFERGQLLLANTFPCQTITDSIYYILYIWKQQEFDQERDELHLTGQLNEKKQLLSELRKYIRQVFITTPATNLDFQAITSCE